MLMNGLQVKYRHVYDLVIIQAMPTLQNTCFSM